MGNALDRVRTAQSANEAATVSAKETTAAQDLKGWIGWLKIHTKEEQKQRQEYFWRLVIACAIGAFGTGRLWESFYEWLQKRRSKSLRVWWAGCRTSRFLVPLRGR